MADAQGIVSGKRARQAEQEEPAPAERAEKRAKVASHHEAKCCKTEAAGQAVAARVAGPKGLKERWQELAYPNPSPELLEWGWKCPCRSVRHRAPSTSTGHGAA
jgi:hypothetical protein